VAEHADELAAVITEPIMRSLTPRDGFLEGLREVCTAHDVPLIFDEVVTGFRVAWGGAQEYYGVEPDLTALGKAIGGGTPVGALVGRSDIMELSDPGRPKAEGGAYVSGTLNGSALCAAAGNATLDILEEPGTYEQLHQVADDLRDVFDDVLADSSLNGLAMCDGPIVDYAITDEPAVTDYRTLRRTDGKTKKKIDRELLREGILQMHGSKRYVSTAHGDDELAETAEAFKTAVERVS
jgi:glutamate-1-semialdehyde 2,1-aminomutase